MTIRAKLIANVLVSAAIIIAISLASYFAMRFLQNNLTYLTRKSTPYQLKTIALQRSLQEHIANLLKTTVSTTEIELKHMADESGKSLEEFKRISRELENMKGAGLNSGIDELAGITKAIIATTGSRLKAENDRKVADSTINEKLQLISASLGKIGVQVKSNQKKSVSELSTTNDSAKRGTVRLHHTQLIANLVSNYRVAIMELDNADSRSELNAAVTKLTSISRSISKSLFFRLERNTPIAVEIGTAIPEITRAITSANGMAEQRRALLSESAGLKPSNKRDREYNEYLQRLSNISSMLVEHTAKIGDSAKEEGKKFDTSLESSVMQSETLAITGDLVEVCVSIKTLIKEMFLASDRAELMALREQCQRRFAQANTLMSTYSFRNLQDSGSITTLLAGINQTLFAKDGVTDKLDNIIKVRQEVALLDTKLMSFVKKQRSASDKAMFFAQEEQEKSVVSVHDMVRRSLSQIAAIGCVAIIIGTLFGFWIYRSVLSPLQVVLDAVIAQKDQVKKKAALAKAVAGGDLDRKVTVNEMITLDPDSISKDEMGMVLKAVIGMSKAQIILDRAFTDMTKSLRDNRETESRRNHIKGGLFELNLILRDEHTISELAESALAFVAGFLDCGVGILYLYDGKKQKLETLATYAIARSARMTEGFMRGEGLPGQVASEKKMVYLDRVPKGYLPITSALGQADPLAVAVLPIMHNTTLVGVLELGSFKAFSKDDYEFLHQALEGIAIAIHVGHSRQMVNELLEQTQAQSEELMAQHEDLQQTNRELEERAQRLAEQKLNREAAS